MPARTAKKIIAVCFILILLTLASGFTYRILTEPTSPPQKIRITNITANSLTISWITEKQAKSHIWLFEKNQLAIPFFGRFFAKVFPDDHNQISTVHHVTLRNLKPDTSYYSYLISTGWRTYKFDQEGKIFPQVETIQGEEAPPLPNPAYGRVIKSDGITAAFPAIIYLTPLDSQTGQRETTLSTITNIEGGWTLDIPTFRDKIEIIVEAGKDGSTAGIFEATQAAPLPTLVL